MLQYAECSRTWPLPGAGGIMADAAELGAAMRVMRAACTSDAAAEIAAAIDTAGLPKPPQHGVARAAKAGGRDEGAAASAESPSGSSLSDQLPPIVLYTGNIAAADRAAISATVVLTACFVLAVVSFYKIVDNLKKRRLTTRMRNLALDHHQQRLQQHRQQQQQSSHKKKKKKKHHRQVNQSVVVVDQQ
jgi:hypothetical protein